MMRVILPFALMASAAAQCIGPACKAGGCSQEKCKEPSCDGGRCVQNGSHGAVCSEHCPQINAVNATCKSNACDQTGCKDCQCNGGRCVQKRSVGVKCEGGYCRQENSVNASCVGGSCDQRGCLNCKCEGGRCRRSPHDRYTKAVQDASAAIAKLEAAVRDLCVTAYNATIQDRLVDYFMKADGGKRNVLENNDRAAQNKKNHLEDLKREAKEATKRIKHLGRLVERASKAAGVPESDYESAYRNSESVSERMEKQAELTGEKGDGCIKTLEVAVARKIKARFAAAPKAGETLPAGGPANGFSFGALVVFAFASAASAAAGTHAYLRRRYQGPFLNPMLG